MSCLKKIVFDYFLMKNVLLDRKIRLQKILSNVTHFSVKVNQKMGETTSPAMSRIIQMAGPLTEG
jgi:hypothetical protein